MINREIDYVMEVAKHGSILKAAEKLYISSSALSKYIQNLEARLEVRLFDRVGKKFVLTYAGERYLHWITKQQELLYEMESELTDIANSIKGTITIGTPFGLSELWIIKTLKAFNQLYPKIKIRLIENVSTEITQLAISNKVDFALVEHTKNDTALCYHNLYEETLVLVSSKNNDKLHSLSKARKDHKYPWISLKNCADMNFVMPLPEQSISGIVADLLKSEMIDIDPLITTRSISSIMNCVLNDLGITVTTDYAVHLMGLQDRASFYSVGKTPIVRQWALAYNKDHYLTEHTKKIINMTIQTYKELGSKIDALSLS